MPIYEYQCKNCGQRARKFWRSFANVDDTSLQCPRCGERQFRRLVSRVAFVRSEESHLENLADPSDLEGMEDNPRAMGRWLRKMSTEMGEEMPPEFSEVIDRLEAGQSPDEIEESMPDLAESMGDMGSGSNDFVDL
jgi:putative FmdB family regulatory protein